MIETVFTDALRAAEPVESPPEQLGDEPGQVVEPGPTAWARTRSCTA